MLFINCKTRDSKLITCCGPIALHKDENNVKTGDLLEFKNVQPQEDKKSVPPKLCIWIRDNSTVNIIDPVDGSKHTFISPIGSSTFDFPTWSCGSRSDNSILKKYKEPKSMFLFLVHPYN